MIVAANNTDVTACHSPCFRDTAYHAQCDQVVATHNGCGRLWECKQPTGGVCPAFFRYRGFYTEVLVEPDKRYHEDWKHRPVAERARIVVRAAQILREKRDEYATYPTLEMGKVTRFSYLEIDLVADILDYYAKHGERLLEPQSLPGEPGVTLVAEPVGVILAIEPWNFPYYQLVRVAAPQLVAGKRDANETCRKRASV
jgi:hypothetical protein